jgi:acyl-coenzyme A synthetase/AMP-(fatty) acid ligase
VNRHGVGPTELEAAMTEHPTIREVAVAASDEKGSKS